MWVRAVHPLATEAFEAYITVMIHHGETMPGAGGVGNCRNIGTSDWPSLHAYLCAIDLPPNSRKSAAFLTSIKAIHTNSGARFFPNRGARVFRNLRGDRMHDQINCSPTALASGIDWTTVIGDGGSDDDMDQVGKAVVDLAFDMGWAEGDRSYWYGKDNDDPEIEDLRAAMRTGAAADRIKIDQGGVGGPWAPEDHPHDVTGKTV